MPDSDDQLERRRQVGCDLKELAGLLKQLNEVGKRISTVIGRPALIGHAGEFIASKVFDLALADNAAIKAIDGHFKSGPLQGKSVNVKWYGKQESLLDITQGSLPDYYLVMTGPKTQPVSSRGATRPWLIEHVYLFDAPQLVRDLMVGDLKRPGVKIGVATSIRKIYWESAEIYPRQQNRQYFMTKSQMLSLAMFRGE